MILLDELKLEMEGYYPQIKELEEVLDLKNAKNEIAELQKISSYPDFWNDIENSQKVLQKIKSLEMKVNSYNKLSSQLDDIITLIEMAIEDNENEETLNEIQSEIKIFKNSLEVQTLSTLLTGEYDSNNAILTFHAGAGGTEAQDWVEMIFRMYTRWAESHSYKVKVLDYLDGDEQE